MFALVWLLCFRAVKQRSQTVHHQPRASGRFEKNKVPSDLIVIFTLLIKAFTVMIPIKSPTHSHPVLEQLWSMRSATAQLTSLLFLPFVQVEMFLLGYALQCTIQVYRLYKADTEEFVTYYPDDHKDDWPSVCLVTEDDRHYNVPVVEATEHKELNSSWSPLQRNLLPYKHCSGRSRWKDLHQLKGWFDILGNALSYWEFDEKIDTAPVCSS